MILSIAGLRVSGLIQLLIKQLSSAFANSSFHLNMLKMILKLPVLQKCHLCKLHLLSCCVFFCLFFFNLIFIRGKFWCHSDRTAVTHKNLTPDYNTIFTPLKRSTTNPQVPSKTLSLLRALQEQPPYSVCWCKVPSIQKDFLMQCSFRAHG